MSKIRILIVDDSVVMRRLLTELVSSDPAFEVVGASSNGRLALSKIPQVNPDVVTLDLEMPEMDGLETLVAIRQNYPRLPVLMLSRFTQRGAATTMDALALGATDYVPMPDHSAGRAALLDVLRQQLLWRIKMFGGRASVSNPVAAAEPMPPRSRSLSELRQRVDVVAIGVSTGGPNALSQLLPVLAANFPVPVVVVQHMPPIFTKHLAERLASKAAIGISEGVAGAVLEPGQVWIAPGDYHMSLTRTGVNVQIKLDQGPEENFCRPAVDVLFRSVAQIYGAGVLAVVLTGMGKDSVRGCECVRQAGGQVLAQDEASSVVWGMPGFVVKTGLANDVLPLDQMGAELVRRCARGRSPSSMGFVPRPTR